MRAPGKRWSEEETRLALYLYFQLPFGHLHSGNPEIQKLAEFLGRTHSSVAMKLSNFASLDPKIIASGRKGLEGASALDRQVWSHFSTNWTSEVVELEKIWHLSNVEEGTPILRENVIPFSFEPYEGPSTAQATIARRVGQGFFRRAVLANFENRCCVTGIAEPILLTASHIKPRGLDGENRHNPANGLCLSATFDRAFDRGLVTLDQSQRVLVSMALLNHHSQATRDYFKPFQGSSTFAASRFDPDPEFLSWHRTEVFVDA